MDLSSYVDAFSIETNAHPTLVPPGLRFFDSDWYALETKNPDLRPGFLCCRGGGIRTPGPREGSPVFKTGAINRSTTPLCTVFLIQECKINFKSRFVKKDLRFNAATFLSSYFVYENQWPLLSGHNAN